MIKPSWINQLFFIMLAFWMGPGQVLATASPIPVSLPVTTMEGEAWPSDTLAGKPLMVVFWANWCLPCRKEVKQINALREQFPETVNVLGINEDEELSQGMGFIRRYGPQYPSIRDQDFELASKMKVFSLPHVLIFSPEGKEVYRSVEPPSPQQLSQLIQEES